MPSKDFTTIEDLVFDRSFRRWVLDPTHEDRLRWETFIREHPSNAALIEQAKAIVYALQINENELSEEEINREISRILSKIDSEILDESLLDGRPRSISIFRTAWVRAAAILIIVSGSLYLFFNRQSANPVDSYKDFAAAQTEEAAEDFNNTGKTLIVLLADGSKVSLEPKSRISYAKKFDGDKREIYLVGEAFFEVEKDPAHPFFVYSNEVVTKVLGTSFRVKAPEGAKFSEVIVRTGKVSVFKKKNFTNADAKPGELGGTVLLPNQQVTYNNQSGTLTKSLVASPVPLIPETRNEFVFDATPVKEVFQKLEKIYGVRIISDDEAISSCSLSARMGNEGFYQKLDLICKSLDATYEIVDGDVVITTVGCK